MLHNYIFASKIKSPLLKGSVQKLNICLKLIRGKSIEEAISIVSSIRKDLSPFIIKSLLSASANAEANGFYDLKSLYIKIISAEKALTLKRYHPRGRGKIFKVNKYYSRLYLEVFAKV